MQPPQTIVRQQHVTVPQTLQAVGLMGSLISELFSQTILRQLSSIMHKKNIQQILSSWGFGKTNPSNTVRENIFAT